MTMTIIKSGIGDILLKPHPEYAAWVDVIQYLTEDERLKTLMDLGINVYFEWSNWIFHLNGATVESLSKDINLKIDELFDNFE